MNGRRKINNVTPKDETPNYYELHYSHNKDARGNNNCSFLKETFFFDGTDLRFDSKETLQKISRILDVSQKELIQTLKIAVLRWIR